MGSRNLTTSVSHDRDTTPDRWLAVDERGTGLRATWRPAHGFVNLSMWRDEHCVETFHLSPVEAGRLISFLVRGLTAAVPTPSSTGLTLVGDTAPTSAGTGGIGESRRSPGSVGTVGTGLRHARGRLADLLERVAQQLRD